MTRLTFHGHSTCSLETDDGLHIVIDPFFGDNPVCELSVDDVEADFILLTHGHFDHIADAIPLAERTGATIVATFEIATYMEGKGLTVSPHHIGGGVTYPFGYVKLTPALHGGIVELPDGEGFTTLPAGFLINLNNGKRFHHAGDTGLLNDMRLLKGMVDVAMVPIGDRFTMGPDDAVKAVEFIAPNVVIPIHYNTWPPIEQDAEAFKAAVGSLAQVEIMTPGDTYDF
ncbi:MAG TPA: metal-dependent hydrolase [Gemmatimonadetes bacterium]|nr:metal-dependent hydrolase [Gemmatimonadota bacterium]|tara:strand:- start:5995 stop:6678 length:684 start_codon:yes stop_codon:yes gene_type:complete